MAQEKLQKLQKLQNLGKYVADILDKGEEGEGQGEGEDHDEGEDDEIENLEPYMKRSKECCTDIREELITAVKEAKKIETNDLEKIVSKISNKKSPRKKKGNSKNSPVKIKFKWFEESKQVVFDRLHIESRNRFSSPKYKSKCEDAVDGGWAHEIEKKFIVQEAKFGDGVTKIKMKIFRRFMEDTEERKENVNYEIFFDDELERKLARTLHPQHVSLIQCIVYVTEGIKTTIDLCWEMNNRNDITSKDTDRLVYRAMMIDEWIGRIQRLRFFQYLLVPVKELNYHYNNYMKELQANLKIMKWNQKTIEDRRSDRINGVDFGLKPNPESIKFYEIVQSALKAHSAFLGDTFTIPKDTVEVIKALTGSYILGLCEDALTFGENSFKLKGAAIKAMAGVYNPRKNPAPPAEYVAKTNFISNTKDKTTLRQAKYKDKEITSLNLFKKALPAKTYYPL